MPNLTLTQLQALKAAILAETDPAFVALRQAGGTGQMAEFLNEPATPAHAVWRTDTPVADILDAINWSLYTPTGSVDDTALADALITGRRTAQLLAIQTKQMNLQSMLQGRDRLDCSKPSIRLGLRDAVTSVPAGSNGGTVNPGGGNGSTVLAACTRLARRAEKIYATVPASTGATTAFLLTYQGRVSDYDVVQATTQV